MKNKNKILAGLGIAVCSVILATLLHGVSLLSDLQKTLSHTLYETREITDDILIVAIDETSMLPVEEGGLGSTSVWTREHYAQVLENIEAAGASAVLFDVLFLSESSGLTTDELIDIALEYPNVQDFTVEALTYAASPHPADIIFADVLAENNNVYLIKSAAGDLDTSNGTFDYEAEILPLDLFVDNANLGFANVVTAEEGSNLSTIYAIPEQISINGSAEEHVDIKLVREHTGNDGDLGIITEGGEMLINYAQTSYMYPTVSFSDVYYGNVMGSEYKDKIVLVGATAASMQDRHFTPIDQNDPMPGVEIHANAIQTILDGKFLQHQSLFGFVSVVALMAFAVVFVSLYAPILAGAGVLLLEIIAFPFYAKASFAAGSIPDLIWPVFAAVAAYLATLAYRNFTEFKEKRELKSAFGHYVSADLVDQIAANPEALKLGGERRNMTVLFVDIENFTSLTESLEPSAVVQIINTYFDAFAKVVMENGGTVDKFEGDCIMALFGAPLPSEDHGLRACKCALALRSKLDELNGQTGQQLNVRVGIASGEAIVGNMGSVDRFDYTAMGDTVNVASRLESGNKFYGTRILVNSRTVDAAQQQIIFRRVDRVRFKGKGEAIDIFEVMGPAGGLSEEGKAVLEEWHQALEYYRNQKWAEAETRIQKVLAAMPEDGPAKAYLARIKKLKEQPLQGWDGTWGFSSK